MEKKDFYPTVTSTQSADQASAFPLSSAQLTQLYDDGFVVLPNVVSPALTKSALRAVNSALGRGISLDEAEKFINGSCFESLAVKPIITDLFNKSAAATIASALLGGSVSSHHGQIALRFPGFGCAVSESGEMYPHPWWAGAWHIDGVGEKRTPGQVNNFTYLMGVLLEDVSLDFSGNLIVFPGSHHLNEQHFREHGMDGVERQGHHGMPKDLPLPPPHMVTGRVGDVVICHYLLAHSVAPNLSPHIRFAVYFRLFSPTHTPGSYRPAAMQDAWLDWHGIRAFVHQRRAQLPYAKRPQYGHARPRPVDVRAHEVREVAETLYEARGWADARPYFAELAQLRPADPMILLKAGVCFTLPVNEVPPDALREGEAYLQRAIQFCANFAPLYATLARNLSQQQRYADVLAVCESLLRCPSLESQTQVHKGILAKARGGWTMSIVDGVRCGCEAASKTSQPHLAGMLVTRAAAAFPAIATELGALHNETEARELWASAKQMMAAPHKDWLAARPVCERLAAMQPRVFWAQLQAAMTYTYAPARPAQEYAQGEQYCRRAIELDPTNAAGYGVLARNLLQQQRFDLCAAAADALVTSGSQDTVYKHEHCALDGLRAGREALLRLERDPAPLVDAFCRRFPKLQPKIAQFLAVADPCRVM